jgi:uncharacterized membrane protein
METLLLLGFGFLFLATLFLPWINRSRIKMLNAEVDFLKKQIYRISLLLAKEGITDNENIAQQDVSLNKPKQNTQVNYQDKQISDDKIVANEENHQIKQLSSDEYLPINIKIENNLKQKAENKQRISFEQQFGARLPVWIGGVSLAFAGFFMVKYSIEIGLLSPMVRIVLGIIFGLGLLYAANWLRSKEGFANGTRIAQSLSGAGIADLYVCIFAATSLYDIIPDFIGFVAMAIVTATAVILSLKHGMPIALLGLIGGFLTPAMVGSNNPSAPTLFIYLYFVIAAILVVIRQQQWWSMAIPSVIGAFLWIFIWVFGGNFSSKDSIYLGLFLMAVSITVIVTSKQKYEQDTNSATDFSLNDLKSMKSLNYITLSGSTLIMGVIASQAGFGFMEWSLFGLISLGGIVLAFFNQKLYGFVPWVSMAVNAVMLAYWNAADTNAFALTIIIFAAIYIVSGYLLQSRSERPLIWSGLVAAASIGYYLLGYYELRNAELIASIPMLWGFIAVAFSGLSVFALNKIIQDVPSEHHQKQHIMAVYAGAATAFLSIGMTIELPREFLSVAFAAQMLAMSWINTRININALRIIVGILAGVFGFLLIPQILLLVQLTVYSLVETQLYLQKSVPIVDWPIFQLGLPALFFVISSYFLRLQKDDRLVRLMEITTIALIGVMGYYLTRHIFHVDENILFVKAGFVERSVISNILFIYALVCLWVGKRYSRQAATSSGVILFSIATFRIIYFDFISHNPLWSLQSVGELPILNALLITYGLPIFWTSKLIKKFSHAIKPKWNKYGYGFMLLLAFSLLSFNVRQFFQGTYLNGYETTNAEIYSYSVAWLLFGIVLLFLGTVKQDKMVRVASLIIMILTVGKVFLYDASELEGLFRVFSFFGLGISLLCLSWFYTRFVFIREGENS